MLQVLIFNRQQFKINPLKVFLLLWDPTHLSILSIEVERGVNLTKEDTRVDVFAWTYVLPGYLLLQQLFEILGHLFDLE